MEIRQLSKCSLECFVSHLPLNIILDKIKKNQSGSDIRYPIIFLEGKRGTGHRLDVGHLCVYHVVKENTFHARISYIILQYNNKHFYFVLIIVYSL